MKTPPPAGLTGPRLLLARLGLAGASLAICLLAAEVALRVQRPHSIERMDLGTFMRTSTQAGARRELIPGASNPHFVGGPVSINQLGLRGPEVTARDPEGTRILAVGDSNVFGYGVAHEDTWHQLVAEGLADDLERPVETLNAGVPGAGLAWPLHFIRRHCDRLDPDLILLGVVLNDISSYPPEVLEDAPLGSGMPPNRLRQMSGWVHAHSYLYATIWRDLRSLMYEPASWTWPRSTATRSRP